MASTSELALAVGSDETRLRSGGKEWVGHLIAFLKKVQAAV